MKRMGKLKKRKEWYKRSEVRGVVWVLKLLWGKGWRRRKGKGRRGENKRVDKLVVDKYRWWIYENVKRSK